MFSLLSRNRTSVRAKKCGSRPTSLQSRFEQLEPRAMMTADMVVQWNAIALEASVNDYSLPQGYQIGPTRLSRAMAIVQAAVFDAVNSIDPQYTPYLTQVTAAPGASIDAAVAQAAHDTLVAIFPNQQSFFDSELASSLAGIAMTPAVDGVAVGQAVASAILNARANDGSQQDAVGQPVNYTFGQMPGDWRPDPLHPNQIPLTPDWGSVTPFAIASASQFVPPPPPKLTSLAYATAYEEVKALGSANSTIRTPEQTDIGFFWGYDGQPTVCAPIRLYNQIAEVIAAQTHNGEVANARFFALTNIAMADAGIVSWDTKYLDNFWRPITAIRENDPGTGPSGLGSGNPFLVGQGDPNWAYVGAPAHSGGTNFTPPFPAYTSGHATIGGALFKMMEDFYGTDKMRFTVTTDEFNTFTEAAISPRSYTSFSQASGENALSRIYLGIHYHFDAAEGIRSGDQIADYIFQHSLLPLHGGAPHALRSMDPDAQIQLAIAYQKDRGPGYRMGQLLDFIAAVTEHSDGFQRWNPVAQRPCNTLPAIGFLAVHTPSTTTAPATTTLKLAKSSTSAINSKSTSHTRVASQPVIAISAHTQQTRLQLLPPLG
jgi:PAP2 superfamily